MNVADADANDFETVKSSIQFQQNLVRLGIVDLARFE